MTTSGNRFIGKINPPPPISTPVESPWSEVEAVIAALGTLSQKLDELISLMSGGAGQITVIIPHKTHITTGFRSVPIPGVAQNLDPLDIQDGYPVTIVASPGNSGNIYLGKTQGEAQDARKRFNGLAPGLAVSLKIQNLSAVWIDVDTANDGVSWIVETDT